jgi:hypothetical protein
VPAPASVTVSVALPPGMELQGSEAFQDTAIGANGVPSIDDLNFFPTIRQTNSGARPRAKAMIVASGWTCNVITVSCSRATPVAPGESYPPIILHVRPTAETADVATPVATVLGGATPAPSATVSDPTEVVPAVPFGITSFTAATQDKTGGSYSAAGGHPYAALTDVRANVTSSAIGGAGGLVIAGGDIKAIHVDLPPGFSANPQNFPQCPAAVASDASALVTCPLNTAIGYVDVAVGSDEARTEEGYRYRGEAYASPLYNTEPEPGEPAGLSFEEESKSIPYILETRLRSDGDYGLTVGSKQIPGAPSIKASHVVICANGIEPGPPPSDPTAPNVDFKCAPAPDTTKPFVNNPSKCAGSAPLTTLHVSSYQHPDQEVENDAYASAPVGPFSYFGHRSPATPVAASFVTGCEALTEQFKPTFGFQPDTAQGDSPAGVEADLHIPQTANRQDTPMTPALKKTVVTLPEGLTLNAAAGNGLGACSLEQIGYKGNEFAAPNPIRFNEDPVACPDSSKIGTLEAATPLLAKRDPAGNTIANAEGNPTPEPLKGTVYLAAQKENPFGSNFAIYLVIDDAKTGIVVKLPGKVEADPLTGRITATFDNNPQLPLEDVRLHFFSGPQASLATPATCGEKTTPTQISPWSAVDPDHPTAAETSTPSSSFEVSSGCAAGNAHLPFALGLAAGSKDPTAGSATPFSFRITRPDGAQEISTIALSPPAGLTAYLAGVAECSAAQIKAAEGQSGKAEQAHPSCPAASQVGTVVAGAGAGSNPYYTTGKLYLAGPYKGAPLSVVAITPAVAGPFDLGDVVVRSAVSVDPATARITAKTDPLPHILEGVPLRIRDIRVDLDRSRFSLNPTSCEPMTVDATVTGTSGASTDLSNRFQVGGCADLPFKPGLSIQLHGGAHRSDYQQLTAVVTAKPGEANIARAAVTLPHSEFLAQNHIRTVCTRAQFAAHECPQGSIYGHAEAITPLLSEPLIGSVYLRSSDNLLPDLVAVLRGPDSMPIEVDLDGRTDSIHGGIRNTFDVVPDAPVTKFTLRLQGGRKSLIVNSRDLCSGPKQRATARFTGQNGKRHDFRPVVGNDCGKKGRKKKSVPRWSRLGF